jgi:hypothetical protein
MDGTKLWPAGDAVVTTGTYPQENIAMTSAEGQFVIIVWEDQGKLRIVKYGTESHSEWTEHGMTICSRWISSSTPQVVYDDRGGAIVVWSDDQSGSPDIYAQHVDSDGEILWAENGIPVSAALQAQYNPAICSDGEGGVLVGWSDYRNGNYDIYAQRMERNGYWGYPAPWITSAFDVPSDQGGNVDLQWDRSRLDAWPDLAVERYSVWRAIDEPLALAAVGGGTPILTTAEALGAGLSSGVIRREMLGGEPFYWELVDYQDAYSLETYSEAVPTMFDSMASNEGWHYFQVIAHAEDRTIYWISEPDSGYSVDNIAPCPPLALAGEQSFTPEGLELTWSPNSDPDLDCYHIYRDIGPSFVPTQATMLASTCDTTVFDGGWTWDSGFCYKLAAVDIHGNESEYIVLCAEQITGDDPMPLPEATFLAQNYPNPFNPITTIVFAIKESGHVFLRIYDAAGRSVATLVDESMPAGSHSTEWNGCGVDGSPASSGVYFYRLVTPGFDETKKMILLR